ncbi:MAG: GGDEF domain-containing protein [Candidatus Dormiibacterota bacterium]
MAPIRETAPAAGSPISESPVAAPSAPPDALVREAPTRDFVGWAAQPELRTSRRLSVEVTRKVLGTALGLDFQVLAGLDAAQLRAALDRLRAMAAYMYKLAEVAATDDLTGALRRSAGLAALQREIDRFRRVGGKGIAVIFLDVDSLKQVNDTQGHPAGDRVLVEVVAAIRKRVRSYDLVIRYGGDEFLCALVDVAPADAERTLADIRSQYAATTGHSVSVGMTSVSDADTAESVIARADAALYSERRKLEHQRPAFRRSHDF